MRCSVPLRSLYLASSHPNPNPMPALASLDWAVIGLYFLIVFGVAIIATLRERRKGAEDSADYFLAGRNVGWFVIGAIALRIEHRERAPRRPRRERGRGGRGAGSVRGPRLDHPPDSRLGLRAVLHQERRLHDAGVPRTPLLAREPVVPRDGLDRGLRPHQNLGDDLRRRRRLPRRRRAVLDRRAHRRRSRRGHTPSSAGCAPCSTPTSSRRSCSSAARSP